MVNPFVHGRCSCNLKLVISKFITRLDHEHLLWNVLRWMPQVLTDDESALVQVMAWCRLAASHFLGQCRPKSVSPCAATRPQWVNTLRPKQNGHHFADDTFKPWIKMLEIRLIFHWSLFQRVKSTILHHWFRLWLDADQATSHYLNQWWLDYRRIYASLGLNELNKWEVHYTAKTVPILTTPLFDHIPAYGIINH